MNALNPQGRSLPAFLVTCLLLGLAGSLPAPAAAQGIDLEPNDDCYGRQGFGVVAYPFTVEGSLDSTPETPDIDYFLFESTPGAIVTVDLEGEATGAGTLPDPVMGAFDGICTFLGLSDDGGTGSNSRMQVVVPPDGLFVIAATAYPDFGFTGGGLGTYRITVGSPEILPAIGSISGRLVDARDGSPIPGGGPSYVTVDLFRCGEVCDTYVTSTVPDAEGRFRFEQDWHGNPLPVGTYQVLAWAEGYDFGESGVFEVGEAEHFDLGDLALRRFGWIGSISGRLVDSESGEGLSGDFPTYAYVALCRVEGSSCNGFFSQTADGDGYFRIDGLAYGLRAGTYLVTGFAYQYQGAYTETSYVDVDEHADVGDLALRPLPLQVLETYPCSDLPPAGGTCRFGARVRNRLSSPLRGQTWAHVTGYTGSPVGWTQFQVGRFDALSPVPQRFNLQPFEEATVEFQLQVPADLPNGAYLCTSVLVGLEPNPLFNTAGVTAPFCFVKGVEGLEVLSDKQARERLRALERELRRP